MSCLLAAKETDKKFVPKVAKSTLAQQENDDGILVFNKEGRSIIVPSQYTDFQGRDDMRQAQCWAKLVYFQEKRKPSLAIANCELQKHMSIRDKKSRRKRARKSTEGSDPN